MSASWALLSLTELVAVVTEADEPGDVMVAVQRIGETLDAEIAAVLNGGEVVTSFGLGRHPSHRAVLSTLSSPGTRTAEIDGLGEVHVLQSTLGSSDDVLVLARTSGEFTSDERAFVRAVGRVLDHATRLLARLGEHESRVVEDLRSELTEERHRADHDALTGLPGREVLLEQIEMHLADIDRVALTVMFVDLDRFKQANDVLGHEFGDRVLITVADRLRTCVRQSDLVGRLAGDEFIVVCPGISDVGAIELAERFQTMLDQPISQDGQERRVTASIGIASAQPGDTATDVISHADYVMYRAKQIGRAQVEVFDNAARAAMDEQSQLGAELGAALRKNEFRVDLQPIVALPQRQVVGFEAMMRWQHPARGTLTPADFLASAEKSGLVVDLDRAILDESLRLLTTAQAARPVAVNVSASTLSDASFPSWVAARLDAHGVPPELLMIEAPESAMTSAALSSERVASLRALGVAVMLDRFGAGSTSLGDLQTLPIDGVKIDRGLTAEMVDDRAAAAIVSAVLGIAAARDIVAVVCGIDDDRQVELANALATSIGGTELRGQGVLFGAPLDGRGQLAGFVAMPWSSGSRVG